MSRIVVSSLGRYVGHFVVCAFCPDFNQFGLKSCRTCRNVNFWLLLREFQIITTLLSCNRIGTNQEGMIDVVILIRHDVLSNPQSSLVIDEVGLEFCLTTIWGKAQANVLLRPYHVDGVEMRSALLDNQTSHIMTHRMGIVQRLESNVSPKVVS